MLRERAEPRRLHGTHPDFVQRFEADCHASDGPADCCYHERRNSKRPALCIC